jgi:hypothetical protein
MPPTFDDYYKECYDIGYNYTYETCHSYDWIAKKNSLSMQLVYHVQILDNNLAPISSINVPRLPTSRRLQEGQIDLHPTFYLVQ